MSISKLLEDNKQERESTSEKLYISISEDILTGKLIKGSKLTERGISQRYDVSRTPAREAIAMLSANGLVETNPNKVTIIKGLSNGEIRDFLFLRQSLESYCAKWTAERIDSSGLKELEELYQFMKFYTQTGDIEKMISINSLFHNMLYKYCNNKLLSSQLKLYRRFLPEKNSTAYHSTAMLQKVFSEHKDIYEAIISHNGNSAFEAMEKHMKNSFHRRLISLT